MKVVCLLLFFFFLFFFLVLVLVVVVVVVVVVLLTFCECTFFMSQSHYHYQQWLLKKHPISFLLRSPVVIRKALEAPSYYRLGPQGHKLVFSNRVHGYG